MLKRKVHKISGDFEYEVISELARMANEGYAVPVAKTLSQKRDKRVQVGTIHTILSRLEDKGFVKSRMGEATAARGGKARRLYHITGEGQAAMREREYEVHRVYGGALGSIPLGTGTGTGTGALA